MIRQKRRINEIYNRLKETSEWWKETHQDAIYIYAQGAGKRLLQALFLSYAHAVVCVSYAHAHQKRHKINDQKRHTSTET